MSAGESNDILLRLLREPVNKMQRESKEKFDEDYKKLLQNLIEFEKSGHKTKDQSFVFAKDANGKKTGLFISKADREGFFAARKKMQDDLANRYGKFSQE